ncbi:Metalloendoproteinase 1 [Vitis vinifera]|uniref:Metalloendoproteinase 1 n=1 Tax=Vitis vinifera TaxID=29760 RepID=A0A438I960_VITVI|nr:Metalloendoproteinase 1 [Vitis vinifera]
MFIKTPNGSAATPRWSAMAPRVSLLLSLVLSSLLLLLLLFPSRATSPFGSFKLESFGSFKHLEGSEKKETITKGFDAWAGVPNFTFDRTVATHELSHILGLAHSQVQDVIMYPYIESGQVKHFTQFSEATSSSPSRVGPFRHLESFGSFKHLEGSKKGDKTEGIQMVKKYLEHYGYLSSTHYSQMDSDDFDDTLESSLKAFQTFYHLKPTGSLDAPTATLMSKPRCGVPDHPTSSNSINPNSHPEEPITRGFQAWTTVSNFTFERVREESFAKIRVYFQVRDKGTAPPLDGPGGILAYAGPSLTNATIHFDGEENWVEGAVADSFDLQTIATHEVGHLLGLGHSRVVKANMYAYTGTAETKPLIQDDIDGIRAKYST